MFKKIKNKYLRILAEFAVMFVLCHIIMLFLSRGVFYDFKSWLYATFYSITIGYILMKGNTYIGNKLDEYFSWLQSPLKRIIGIVLLGSLFTAIVTGLMNTIFYLTIFNMSINDFMHALKNSLLFTLVIYIIVTLIVYAFIFYYKWRNLALEHEKQKNETLRLQFDALRNQVNPHFLFNSLSTLSYLIESDKHKAIEFVNNLSDTYRYIIDNKDRDLVQLHEEMNFVNAYIQLQNIRFGTLIDIKNEVTTAQNQYVIPVSIQMLIENVFKHNSISKEKKITIEMWIENNYLFVRNNMNNKPQDEERTATGLANIRKRYEYLSNKECIFENKTDYFIVGLPLLTNVEIPIE